MAAPKQNQFWKIRSSHGREKLFATPELLWQAAEEYFNWCDGHPFYKVEAIKSGDRCGDLIKIPVPRPYTLEGFLGYVDAGKNYWSQFKKANHEDFAGVIGKIDNTLYNNKFSGAASGFFNPTIIARDLGLRDNMAVTDGEGNPLQAPTTIIVQQGDTNGFEIKESE